jgi:hypothetical protein
VVGRVGKVEMPFYSSEGWELGYLRRVVGGGSADSMLRFWLERGRWDEALPEDEADAASSSWLQRKEA